MYIRVCLGDRLCRAIDEACQQRGGVDVQEAAGRPAAPVAYVHARAQSCHSHRAGIYLELSGNSGGTDNK